MTFSADVAKFAAKVKATGNAVRIGVAVRVHESIVGGGVPGAVDPLTGAPGQPVQTGNLRASWIVRHGATESEVSTNAAYAPAIEDGIGPHGPLTLRSAVGGFHSVKLTVAGANRIQDAILREVTR